MLVSGPVLARHWAGFPWGLAPVLGVFWSPIGGAAVLSGDDMESVLAVPFGGLERSGVWSRSCWG